MLLNLGSNDKKPTSGKQNREIWLENSSFVFVCMCVREEGETESQMGRRHFVKKRFTF